MVLSSPRFHGFVQPFGSPACTRLNLGALKLGKKQGSSTWLGCWARGSGPDSVRCELLRVLMVFVPLKRRV